MSVHKKIQPNRSSRPFGWLYATYINTNVLFYYINKNEWTKIGPKCNENVQRVTVNLQCVPENVKCVSLNVKCVPVNV